MTPGIDVPPRLQAPVGLALRTLAAAVRWVPINRRVKAPFIARSLVLRSLRMSHEFTSKRIGVRWSARGFPDLLTRHMMFEGCYQEDVLATLRATLRPGDVLYDVGAHHGLMSVIGSLAVGPIGRVVSFEPNPTAREHLHEHLRLNGCANVTVEPLAVYDRAGSFDFYVQTGNVSWNSSLVRDFADPKGTIAPIKVPTVTLDSYVASAKLVPNLVKIDVEGSELSILKGATGTIEAHQPILVLEFNPKAATAAGTSIDELVRWLAGVGYRLIVLKRNVLGYYHFDRQERFDLAVHCREDALANVVCLPPGRF